MELFKSKKFSRKKLIQTIIEKLHHQNDFRVTPIFKIIIRICQTNAEVCRKTSKFLLKRCLFIFCIFYLNEEELIKQVSLIKYRDNEFSNATSHKTKKKQLKRSENIIQPRHCVVKLNRPVTNYHKLLFLSRSNPDENLKNKN